MMQKYNRFRARWKLLRKYLYLIEVDRLLEEYETKKILDPSLSDEQKNNGRKNLLEIQLRIRGELDFVDFLKQL